MRTHLFVAPGSAAFGEVVLGIRLARELVAAGDRVLFLAPAAHALLFAGTPITHGHIDRIAGVLDRALPDVIREKHCDTVVICDLLLMLLALGKHRIDPAFLDHLGVPTFALDIWDLRRSNLRFDMCEAELPLPDDVRSLVPRRLVPVPFARPDSDGAYCALPPLAATDDRAATRTELGIGADPLIVLTTARFQDRGLTPFQQHAAATVPAQLADLGAAVGARVLHIGPRAVDGAGAHYRFAGQVAPRDFERFLRAADLLVTPNQAATGITTALAAGTPALAVISGAAAYPFRVFPIGLHHFMLPILHDNPYVGAVATSDVSPPDALVARVRELLFDADARAALTAAMRSYVERVHQLPSGGSLLSSPS